MNKNLTEPMLRCLSLLITLKITSTSKHQKNVEKEKLEALLKKTSAKLSDIQNKIVVSRAQRIIDEHHDVLVDTVHEEYGYCDDDEIENYYSSISINFQYYELWKQAVRTKNTVKMVYDSVSSGLSERLVDPYKSRVPYGEGFCHSRKEVRKFRFDRVIDLVITNNTFIKKADDKNIGKESAS